MKGEEKVSRREILVRAGKASALLTFCGAFVESFADNTRSSAAVHPAAGTRPESTPPGSFFRMDLGIIPPVPKEDRWRLRISGLVERPLDLGLSDIRKLDPLHQFATLACITNPVGGGLIGTTRWTGVSLQRFLREIRPLPKATHLKIGSADGFYEILAIERIRKDPRVMLAYEWDGAPLPVSHGFPLRVFIPDVYGMKQPKWIRSIELTDKEEKGYWVKRGWDPEARIRAMSVIDTTATPAAKIERNGQTFIPLGGMAFAGTRGISRVQIQVDSEAWRDAKLRTPLSDLCWVLWRFEWPFRSGPHTFTVRCFEGNGTVQIAAEAPPDPSGSTGYHRIRI